jgi:hypothetical protein
MNLPECPGIVVGTEKEDGDDLVLYLGTNG